MRILVTLLSAALIVSAGTAQARARSPDNPPKLAERLSYPRLKQALDRLGYSAQPVYKRDGRLCDDPDNAEYRCHEFPEAESCSADGYCWLLFRRRADGRILRVLTYMDKSMGAQWSEKDDLSGIEFPPGVTWRR